MNKDAKFIPEVNEINFKIENMAKGSQSKIGTGGMITKIQAAKNPSIVMFSTVAVKLGMPFHSSVSSSKGAIEGLTRSLAAEFAPKIRVNSIAPSILETPMSEKYLNSETKLDNAKNRHPLKEIGSPKDISEIVKFLLEDNSKWMTGQIIPIDGGMSSIKTN